MNTDCPVCKNDLNGCLGKVTEEPAPEETEQPEAETEKSGGNTGMIIFLVIALAAAGGLGYYGPISATGHIKPMNGIRQRLNLSTGPTRRSRACRL